MKHNTNVFVLFLFACFSFFIATPYAQNQKVQYPEELLFIEIPSVLTCCTDECPSAKANAGLKTIVPECNKELQGKQNPSSAEHVNKSKHNVR
jgi:hypothetical protein